MNKKSDNEQPVHDQNIAYNEEFINHTESSEEATEFEREDEIINIIDKNISQNWLYEIH